MRKWESRGTTRPVHATQQAAATLGQKPSLLLQCYYYLNPHFRFRRECHLILFYKHKKSQKEKVRRSRRNRGREGAVMWRGEAEAEVCVLIADWAVIIGLAKKFVSFFP